MRFKPSNLLQILGLSAFVLAGINLMNNKNYEDRLTNFVETSSMVLYGAGLLTLSMYIKRKMPESDYWSK